MNKNITQKCFVQALFSNYRQLTTVISSLSRSDRVILDYMIRQNIFHNFSMYESQVRIADILGYARETVNRSIKRLVSLGLIVTKGIVSPDFNFGTLQYETNRYLFKYKFFLYEMLPSLRRASIHTLKKLGLITNVTPYKKDSIYLPRKYILQVRDRARAMVRSVTGHINFNKNKQERVMTAQGDIIITPTLREITQMLKLTKHGQIKLLAFDDKVLSLIWNQCKSMNHIDDPFAWIVANCVAHCTKNSIPVDFDMYYLIMKRYGIDKNAPYVQRSHFKQPSESDQKKESPSVKNILEKYGNKPHPVFGAFGFYAYNKQDSENIDSMSKSSLPS